jgi:hypothetical protein
VLLSPEKGPSWFRIWAQGARRSRGRRAWWQRTRVRGVPRRGEGRGDGAAAAGLHACVPRWVHRPLARRAPDVPGVPVDRSLIDSIVLGGELGFP